MKKTYRLPIYGKLLSKKPPRGDNNKPVQPISLFDLPDPPQAVKDGKFTDIPILYNFDKDWCDVEVDANLTVHDWLTKCLTVQEGKPSALAVLIESKKLILDKSACKDEI
jgi:hypothetical protein